MKNKFIVFIAFTMLFAIGISLCDVIDHGGNIVDTGTENIVDHNTWISGEEGETTIRSSTSTVILKTNNNICSGCGRKIRTRKRRWYFLWIF